MKSLQSLIAEADTAADLDDDDLSPAKPTRRPFQKSALLKHKRLILAMAAEGNSAREIADWLRGSNCNFHPGTVGVFIRKHRGAGERAPQKTQRVKRRATMRKVQKQQAVPANGFTVEEIAAIFKRPLASMRNLRQRQHLALEAGLLAARFKVGRHAYFNRQEVLSLIDALPRKPANAMTRQEVADLLGQSVDAFKQALKGSRHPLYVALNAARIKVGKYVYFKRDDVLRLLDLHPKKQDNAMTSEEVAKILGRPRKQFQVAVATSSHPLYVALNAARIKVGKYVYFKRDDVLRLLDLHPKKPDNAITLQEAADLLGLSAAALRVGVATGKQQHYLALKAIRFKVGHLVYFKADDAARIINSIS